MSPYTGIFIFFSLLMISSVISLKCYICDEQLQSDCRRHLKSEFIQECPIRHNPVNSQKYATGCSILISEHPFYHTNKETNVRRACYYGDINIAPSLVNYDEGCVESSSSKFLPKNCTTCAGDYCNDRKINSSTTINTIPLMITLLSIMVIKLSLN